MKRVLFYTQNAWAFGSIHQALCKELYQHNIHADVLDWKQTYSPAEWRLLNSVYDVFVTNPDAVMYLYKEGIPFNKIVVIAHAQWDLYLSCREHGLDFFNEVRGFAVISSILVSKSQELGIVKKPKITPLGIHFDLFYSDIHSELKNVGYAGVKTTFNFSGVEIKRGHLAEQAVSNVAGLQLVPHAFYYHLCMPGYYKNIDCVIQSSLEEGGGLPAMEGAAAGRLIIGTPAGYLEENGAKGAGVLVPFDETGFLKETTEYLTYYRDNPAEYRQKCESIQQFARENYDWSVVIQKWIEVLA